MASLTTTLKGKKHRIPRCMISFLDVLSGLDGVESIGQGRFSPLKEYSRKQINKIKYYDEPTRTLKLKVNFEEFSQDFYLRVKPGERENVERFILNYGEKLN